MKGNKRKKRMDKLKKLRNIIKNNASRQPRFIWRPVVVEPEIKEVGQNVLQPKDIDPDWDYREAKQQEMERDEERLQAWADNDLNK